MQGAMEWTYKAQQKATIINTRKYVKIKIYIFLNKQIFFEVNVIKNDIFQGNEAVLFQPASELLPMIEEVCSSQKSIHKDN